MFIEVCVPVPFYPNESVFDYSVPKELQSQIKVGSLVEVPFARRKTWALVVKIKNESDFQKEKIKELSKVLYEGEVFFDEKRILFLRFLSKKYFYPLGEVCESSIPSSIRDYDKKSRPLKKATQFLDPGRIEKSPELNAKQSEALNKIQSAFHTNKKLLLWGVTGSGKTEVYLRAIEACIKNGQSALVLVPEISLTPQLMERFEARFPSQVALFHSSQKASLLRKDWLDVCRGNKKIVIGARSAVFVPLNNPGLLIMDEEHDSSYKQEERLRYHCREALRFLSDIYKIPFIRGSATPSFESLYEVKAGQCEKLCLPDRAVENSSLPSVEIVDLKKKIAVQNNDPLATLEQEENGFSAPSSKGDFFISERLHQDLKAVLENKKQAILFLNRRGIASQVICRHCGLTLKCPSCDVSLTIHKKGALCHYCLFEKKFPLDCPDCRSKEFLESGIGTQAIEEELQNRFDGIKVLRLDQDTTEKSGAFEKILASFKNKEADVLLGTQMVAKGHDFPDVTLVGILLADMGLGIPDFRAREKTYQLLLQVAGRAGRAQDKGHVIVQCFQPENSLFSHLQKYRQLEDYEKFFDEELSSRKTLFYPPYGSLICLRFDSLSESLVMKAAEQCASALKKIKHPGLIILGPAPAPLYRIQNRYRWQILLKSQEASLLEKSCQWIINTWYEKKLEKEYKCRLIIDVDPLQFL